MWVVSAVCVRCFLSSFMSLVQTVQDDVLWWSLMFIFEVGEPFWHWKSRPDISVEFGRRGGTAGSARSDLHICSHWMPWGTRLPVSTKVFLMAQLNLQSQLFSTTNEEWVTISLFQIHFFQRRSKWFFKLDPDRFLKDDALNDATCHYMFKFFFAPWCRWPFRRRFKRPCGPRIVSCSSQRNDNIQRAAKRQSGHSVRSWRKGWNSRNEGPTL